MAWDARTWTEFLVDHRNHTGYQQVVRETHLDADSGLATKTVDYSIGHDEITQTTQNHDAAGNPTGPAATLVFGHDGHGNVRVLTDLAAAVVQMFVFDAYGQMLALYNGAGVLQSGGNGTFANASLAATNLLYSGEQFDTRIGQQYLRARYYNATTGTFNRLDPFFGNLHDPPSFHKYLYTHADPLNAVDPTGMFFSAVGSLVVSGINGAVRGLNKAAVYTAKQAAWASIETGLEVIAGKLLASITGVPFDIPETDLWRTFRTNFVVNLATSWMGHGKRIDRIRNAIDFAMRTVIDIAVDGRDPLLTAGINLVSLSGSALLASYGQKLLGRSIAKWGGCFVAGTPVVVRIDTPTECAAGTHVGLTAIATERKTITQAIETVALGSRVITEAPTHLPIDSEFGEPDQETWAQINLRQHRPDGTQIEMELLRPQWWIHLLGLHIGSVIELPFPELQTIGYAKVLSIADCPPIEQSGEGQVIIGRFVTRQATNVLRVILVDGSEIIGTTNHPMWSVTEDDWRPLHEFAPGDLVRSLDGEARIKSILPAAHAADVFNIEVNGDHVYRILSPGLLVHNADYAPQSLLRDDNALYAAIGRIANHTAHHLIPVSLVTKPGLVRFFQKAARDGWNLNGARNGMNLDNIVRHVNAHPKYNDYIEDRIRTYIDVSGGVNNITGIQARHYLEGVADSMRKFLNNTSGDINELFVKWY